MEKDWIDEMVRGLARTLPGLAADAYQVTGRIARIAAHIARQQEDLFGRYGLNRGEVGVLGALRIAGPPHTLSPTQLFRGLMLSSAGMTSRLDRLEGRGLVARQPHPTDRRGVVVHLTDRGLELVDAVLEANTKEEAKAVETLSAAQRKTLAILLRKLLLGLEGPTGA